MANIRTKCAVCGREIIQSADAVKAKCDLCGKEFTSHNYCPNGHHVCIDCVAQKTFSKTIDYYLTVKSKNPIEIAENIMDSPDFTLIGCKHYFAAALSLYAAYKNSGGNANNFEKYIGLIINRIKEIPASLCKSGVFCGIPIAAGMTIQAAGNDSVDLENHTTMSSKLMGFCITKMFDDRYLGSMDCCKRNTYMCILASSIYIAKNLNVEMEMPYKIVCKYSKENPRCNKERCLLYYGKMTDTL